MDISRRGLVRDALGTSAALAGLAGTAVARASAAADPEDDYYRRLVKANDASLPSVFEQLKGSPERFGARGVGEAVDALAGAYCAPESSYFKSQALLTVLEEAADKLLAAQHADGTIDSGNLYSPPDTGFVVQTLCTALAVLQRMNLPQLLDQQQTGKVCAGGRRDVIYWRYPYAEPSLGGLLRSGAN